MRRCIFCPICLKRTEYLFSFQEQSISNSRNKEFDVFFLCCKKKTMAIGIFGLIPSSSPDELRKVLQELSTKWGDVVEDFETLEVKPMKGAMTNEVFMVSWPRKETNLRCRKLLVRIYGKGVELFFNRDDEIRTFEYVARHGHGPTLLGRFAGGRVEEFIHARVNYYSFIFIYLFIYDYSIFLTTHTISVFIELSGPTLLLLVLFRFGLLAFNCSV